MASLDSLPPDQRAVIQLVLQQGRSYDDIAALLSIDRGGVRQRALDAFDALGPDTSVSSLQRALLTDYLLGQLPGRVAEQVHAGIADSPAERAWLRVVASEVGPLASGLLPEIPAAASRAPTAPAPASRRSTAPAPALRPGIAVVSSAAESGAETRSRSPARREAAASRRGGAIVLGLGGLLLAAVVVVVLLITGGGKAKHRQLASRTSSTLTPATTTASTSIPSTSTPSTSTTSTTAAKFVTQVNLNSPSAVKSRKGIAQVISEGATLGVLIVAQNVPANTQRNAYAVWLYNSGADSKLVGFVNTRVGSNGRLETEGPLPANAAHYKHMLVTIESQQKPKRPGSVVLEGSLNLS